ncbi:MAG: two-component regulator propeller domain-containing protein [Candidatus Cloacimonetes bacterium]|nr:two-component regulator propeller domain-containing protein [Candidatus Cloacimonadota bacterium]
MMDKLQRGKALKIVYLHLMLILASFLGAQAAQWEFYNARADKSPILVAHEYIYYSLNPGLGRMNLHTLETESFYTFNSRIGAGRVHSLYLDYEGSVWIGGANWLCSIDISGDWQRHDLTSAPLPPLSVDAIVRDEAGLLWLGCSNGLFRTNFFEWHLFDTNNTPLQSSEIRTLLLDYQQRVWIGTGGTSPQLAVHDNQAWQVFEQNWGDIRFLLEDMHNQLWMGCDSGLKSYDGEGWTNHGNPGLYVPWGQFSCGAADDAGRLYIGSLYGHIFSYDGTDWAMYNSLTNPSWQGNPLSMATDNQGNLYYASSILYRNLQPLSWIDQIQNQFPVTAFHTVSQNRLWTAHSYSGLSCFDGNIWQSYDQSTLNHLHYGINDLASDAENNLWAIGDDYIIRQYQEAWSAEQIPLEGDLELGALKRISIGPRGRIWIGSTQELLLNDGNGWQRYTNQNSPLPGNRIYALDHDLSGRLWIATDAGIAVNDRDTWRGFTSGSVPFLNQPISDLLCDAEGRVWARDNQALYKYENRVWSIYLMPYNSEVVNLNSSLGMDMLGRIWLIIPGRGIGIFDGSGWEIINSNNSHLQSTLIHSLYSDPRGKIWLGTPTGVQTCFLELVSNEDHISPIEPGARLLASPNPFNPCTNISFQLDRGQHLSLKIYNLKGELVNTLHEGFLDKGQHSLIWDGTDDQARPVSSGIYLSTLQTGESFLTGKMVLIK